MACSIQTVAVIGAGKHGLAFALRCAERGFTTVLQDVLSARLRGAEAIAVSAPSPLRDRLQTVSTLEDAVREADVAIDFVPDELESKLEIFSLLDRMAPPKTVLCTPTGLSISDLASCTYRADHCVRLTFAPAGDELDLLHADGVSPAALEAVDSWLQALGFGVHTATEASFAVQETV